MPKKSLRAPDRFTTSHKFALPPTELRFRVSSFLLRTVEASQSAASTPVIWKAPSPIWPGRLFQADGSPTARRMHQEEGVLALPQIRQWRPSAMSPLRDFIDLIA
ncbi:predicted protein [Coccidioides posadasii str. Silveira]|uniref:Predicted protein n=1 Tax=Coccidioides posadasii (strain RMSCC 757 / Silveira) TaxID=443226 RepID=E9DIW8_COCPS|nr:predicted protein [Coccidioides posadasii str. Silveira]